MIQRLNVKLLFLALLFNCLTQFKAAALNETSASQIVQKIVQRLQKNEGKALNYGYLEEALSKEFTDEGKLSEMKKRTYRIIWIENEQYAEMIRSDDKELTPKLKEEEQKRRNKFVSSLHKKQEDDEDDLTWQELFEKYDFQLLPSEGSSAYVIQFQPKERDLKERSRIEKIYNHLSGTIWADGDYNLLKAAATLTNGIRFGLGILGKVEDLQLNYIQQEFDQIWLPKMLNVHYKARILLRTRRHQLDVKFYDPYPRSKFPGSPPGKSE